MKIFAFAFVSALSLIALPTQASILTVTFDDLDLQITGGGMVAEGESQGFTYQTSTVYSGASEVTLTDDGGLVQSTIGQGGVAFTPLSIELRGISNIYRTGPGDAPDRFKDPSAFDAWTMEGDPAAPGLRLTGLFLSGQSVRSCSPVGSEPSKPSPSAPTSRG